VPLQDHAQIQRDCPPGLALGFGQMIERVLQVVKLALEFIDLAAARTCLDARDLDHLRPLLIVRRNQFAEGPHARVFSPNYGASIVS
jgi:hypothetical protein